MEGCGHATRPRNFMIASIAVIGSFPSNYRQVVFAPECTLGDLNPLSLGKKKDEQMLVVFLG